MSLFRRKFLAASAAMLFAFQSVFVFAAPQPWDDAAFRAAQATGKPILIDVYADW